MCVPGCQEAVRLALSRRGFFKGAAAATAARFAATAAAPAQAQRSFGSVVDLTHTMSPEFPTFFGVPGIELEKKFDIKKDGFNLNWWRIIEHAGTHLDAPIHFSETARPSRRSRPSAGRAARGRRRRRQGGAEPRLHALA